MEGYNPTPPYHLGVLADAEMLQAREAYRMKVEVDADWIVEVSQFNMMCDNLRSFFGFAFGRF